MSSARSVALAALGLTGCATSSFTLVYCEDDAGDVSHCDCSRARREAPGGRLERIEVREHARGGSLAWRHQDGLDRQFVLRGRWLVLRIDSRSDGPLSVQTWLDCDRVDVPGEVVHREIARDPSGMHEHEFLVLFAGSPGLLGTETPVCRMHVALTDGDGWGLTRMVESVYFVEYVTRAGPFEGMTWGVAIADDEAPMPRALRDRLAPPPPPPAPNLCVVGAAEE